MTDFESGTDTVYATPHDCLEQFKFDEGVAEVFPDMINRSVPGYRTMLEMLGQLSAKFSQAQCNYYDLGCSLGAATLAMRRNISKSNGTIIAVDNSKPMLKRAEHYVNAYNYPTEVQFKLACLNQITIENAAIVVLNFTLQFIELEKRQALLDRIYRGLNKGGLLFISEKLSFANTEVNNLLVDLHHRFKKANGYSELEISQKRQALENVLLPETYEAHQLRFERAGFKTHSLWYQNMNFASMIAIKD